MQNLEQAAELFAKSRNEISPIYANGLYYGFIQCGNSKWFESEKIKAQIEILEETRPNYDSHDRFFIDDKIEQLNQILKDLENN